MKINQILPILIMKQTKYIRSKSLDMYDQNLKSIKKWLFTENCRYFNDIIKATDWEIQPKNRFK